MNKKELHNIIKSDYSNICQIVVYKDNKKVYSEYFNNFKKEDTLHIMSVTKSITSLLIGIAIDRKEIKSIEDKVLDYFPNYKVKKGEKTIYDITIKDLLTMKAPYKHKGDPWNEVCLSENWLYLSLDFLGGKKGLNDEFHYQSVCLHILSGILYKATNMKTVDYANKYLFVPLGIKKRSNYFAKTKEEQKKFLTGELVINNSWFCDPSGLATSGYGLCMSAEEMAKIGLLCLNKGKYNGTQIISNKWLKEMRTSRKVKSSFSNNMEYGYLWWIINKNIYAAIGNSGNTIYINTLKNIVVSITSSLEISIFDRIDFIQKYIETLVE